VPYVSKATGQALAKIGARCMAGKTLREQGARDHADVLPVKKRCSLRPLPGVDTILGPEMKSTGEVMGVGETFGEAFVKSQSAAGVKLPTSGKAFISVRDATSSARGAGGARLADMASRSSRRAAPPPCSAPTASRWRR